jgi:hypothetical protein
MNMSSKIITRPTFQVGDKVKWDSQAGGFHREKRGTVVAVLLAGYRPLYDCRFDETKFNPDPLDLRTGPRNHESYVVLVPGKTPKTRPKLYWPVVTRLRRA